MEEGQHSSPRANYIYFSTKPRNPIFACKFSFYNLHTNKQNLWNEKLSKKKMLPKTNFVACTELWIGLALLVEEGQPYLSAFIWKKIPALLGEISGSQ